MIGRRGTGGRARLLVLLAGWVLVSAPPAAALAAGSSAEGERLFTGASRLANGGPPCISCHDFAGLPFPHGGALGPNLTGTWSKYGPEAIQPVLKTLFFPTMVPVFSDRPLTPAEREDLAAFFRAGAGRTPARATTADLAALAVVGLVVLLAAAGRVWASRLRAVRVEFLEKARRSKEPGR